MRHYLLLLFIGFTLCLTSCREDFHFEPSSGGLEFSRDTVYLDTVFTNIGSSTYTLKVYNRSNKDIKIPTIQLGQKENSKYRLMVDGVPGKVFNDVELLAKDSMFVFIETTIDYNEYANDKTDFLYTDKIEFSSTSGIQKVELVTLVQDAVFLFPQRDNDGMYEAVRFDSDLQNPDKAEYIYGFNLSASDPINGNELHWKKDKPYVVYGYATVPNGATLEVDPGTRVHFHANSGLMVRPGATLNINGTKSTDLKLLENEVIFEGDRLEPDFAEIPGQWGTILLMSGMNNSVNHLTIKNATIGIYAQAPKGDDATIPKITLNNSQIYNSANYGILARRSNISGANLVANNAGQAAMALIQGGTYNFKQSTFANYFTNYGQIPVILNDYQTTETAIVISDLTANFDNCILYGTSNFALSLENKGGNQIAFKCNFNHSLIKMVDFNNQLKEHPLYPFAGNNSELVNYNQCIIAKTSTADKPDFLNPQQNKLNIGDAPGGPNGSADPAIAALVGPDILGTPRSSDAPDMGAYESVIFPEED